MPDDAKTKHDKAVDDMIAKDARDKRRADVRHNLETVAGCVCDPSRAFVPVDPVAAQDPTRRCGVCGGVRPA